MAQYNFESPGAAATQALIRMLAERQAQERQAQLDELARRNTESLITDRAAASKRADAQAASEDEARKAAARTAEATGQRAAAEIVPKGTELTPELESALGPFATNSEKTYGVLSGSDPNMQGPTLTKTYKGTAKQGQNEEALALKAYIADLTAQSKQQALEVQKAVLEGRMNDAQARLALQQANLELREKLGNAELVSKGIQDQLNNFKLDKEKKEKDTAEASIKGTRADIRSLIDEISNNKSLGNVVGPLAGRIPSVMPESVQLQKKIDQLNNIIALGNSEKLRGQGAISNFEREMLITAGNALTQITDPVLFKKELAKLRRAFEGDTPREGIHGEPAPPSDLELGFIPDGGQ